MCTHLLRLAAPQSPRPLPPCYIRYTKTSRENFIRTIDERPFLAEFVKFLSVYLGEHYLPFARPYLVRRLCNLRRLEVSYEEEQIINCPITYNWQFLIHGFAITDLDLRGYRSGWPDIFRPIWWLRTLQSLYLDTFNYTTRDALTEQSLSRLSTLRRLWSCQKLTSLHIGGDLLGFHNFPPPHASGSNVRILSLECPVNVPVLYHYQNLLEHIALFHSLQEITFSDNWPRKSEDCRQLFGWVCEILCAVQDPRTLRKISLLYVTTMIRDDFLAAFWTNELSVAMKRFDNLQRIAVDVQDTRASDEDVVWWTERIAERIPGLVHLLKVTVTRDPSED